MKRSIFVVVFLCLASFLFAGDKSYPMTLIKATKVGNAELAKGFYTVKLDGQKAIFTDAKRNEVTVAGKVSDGAGKKFDMTSIESSEKGGTPVIKAIKFGGSTTSIEFTD